MRPFFQAQKRLGAPRSPSFWANVGQSFVLAGTDCVSAPLLALSNNLLYIHLRGQSLPTNAHLNGFTPLELRRLRRLKSPAGIQKFLDSLPYHLADTS